LVQNAFGVFSGFVGHEAVDEFVRCLRDGHAGERAVEEVGVPIDGALERDLEFLGEDFEVIVCGCGVWL